MTLHVEPHPLGAFAASASGAAIDCEIVETGVAAGFKAMDRPA
ncbi:hypothetical protein [Rhodococcus sp. HNM0563]|nr:hypothetical protein [Rhodococcus sp. HNM0563]